MRNLLFFSTLSIALTGLNVSAKAADRFEAGQLTCDLSGDVGAILGARQDARCVFQPSGPGSQTTYDGTITEFGIDVGVIDKAELVWAVDAVIDEKIHDLAGSYRGAEAAAAFGLGAGALVLTGGATSTLTLQPVALEGEEGINVAVGVVQLNLKPAN